MQHKKILYIIMLIYSDWSEVLLNVVWRSGGTRVEKCYYASLKARKLLKKFPSALSWETLLLRRCATLIICIYVNHHHARAEQIQINLICVLAE